MRKILVCQHVPYEPLGTLNPLFKEHGFRIRYVNFGRHPDLKPTLEGYHGLIILGGPMNVDEVDRHPHLAHEVELIRESLRRDIPVLGICLGSQLIAHALGAEVKRNPEKEIGWYDVTLTEEGKTDPVMGYFQPQEKLFQWHGDTFDIPEGAVHLALSGTCASQAFRYGSKVYGFQFHLEVDEPMIQRWFQVPHHLEELRQLGGRVDPEAILGQTPLHIERLKSLSTHTFTQFLRLFGPGKKFRCLPSR